MGPHNVAVVYKVRSGINGCCSPQPSTLIITRTYTHDCLRLLFQIMQVRVRGMLTQLQLDRRSTFATLHPGQRAGQGCTSANMSILYRLQNSLSHLSSSLPCRFRSQSVPFQESLMHMQACMHRCDFVAARLMQDLLLQRMQDFQGLSVISSVGKPRLGRV